MTFMYMYNAEGMRFAECKLYSQAFKIITVLLRNVRPRKRIKNRCCGYVNFINSSNTGFMEELRLDVLQKMTEQKTRKMPYDERAIIMSVKLKINNTGD